MVETARRVKEIEVIFEVYDGQANAHPLWGEYEELIDSLYAMLVSFIDLAKKMEKTKVSCPVPNTSREIRKGFDNWISENFKGLSAFTLVQLFKMETKMSDAEIENVIYVDLYNLYAGKDKTQLTKDKFDACKYFVECVDWL